MRGPEKTAADVNRLLVILSLLVALGVGCPAAGAQSRNRWPATEERAFLVNCQATSGGKVAAHFIRPTSEGHDFVVDLAPAPDGRYVGDIAMPLPGQWDVEIDVSHPQGDYRITRRIIVK